MDFRNHPSTVQSSVSVDAGLRAYMLRVYNYMASGLFLTGIVALIASQSTGLMGAFYNISPEGMLMGMKPLGWLIAFSPLVAILVLSFGIERMQSSTAQACFWGFSVLMGLSMANLFLIYTGESIARTFFITAGMFGGMSLYGYTTKRDLTGIGSFLIMGVWGLMLASIANIFFKSSGLAFGISVIGVFVFIGLTAYDTQRLKLIYQHVAGNGEALAKAAIMGALNLYLDFINLFVMLLRFVGDRR